MSTTPPPPPRPQSDEFARPSQYVEPNKGYSLVKEMAKTLTPKPGKR